MFASYLLLGLTRPRIVGPLGLLAIAALAWWGLSAASLLQQVRDHAPTSMTLREALAASRDGEVYVRIRGARLDCDKTLGSSLGNAVALVEASGGEVGAMAHLDECPPVDPTSFEGVFVEPPYGLYGAAVERGWEVTPGHLAFFEPDPSRSRAWTRLAIALFCIPVVIACFASGVMAERRAPKRRAWRMRAVGFGVMTGVAWFFYYAHEYVFLGVIPAKGVMAVAFAVALAFVLLPDSEYMKKVARNLHLDA